MKNITGIIISYIKTSTKTYGLHSTTLSDHNNSIKTITSRSGNRNKIREFDQL